MSAKPVQEVLDRPRPQQPGTDLARADMTYSHAALEPIGGYFTIDLRYSSQDEAQHTRDLLSTLRGSPS